MVRFFLINIITVCFLIVGCAPKTTRTSLGVEAPGLQEGLSYTPQSPYLVTYENGFKVLFIPDNELPLVKMALYFRGGSYYEDHNNYGVTELMGSMLRKGGAGNLTADQLDLQLRKLSATISSSIGGEFGTISMECLDQDLREVFGLFSDVVFRPRFQHDRLVLLKQQLVEAISRRRDDPWTIASISLNQLLYGNSVLGRVLTSNQVQKVQTWQLKRAYRDVIDPSNAILTVTGRLSLDLVKELVNQEFAYLKEGTSVRPELQPLLPEPQARVVFVESELAQATVLIGQLGAPRYSPDHFPILVYNEVFSGGMGALLSKKIRSDLGLAYAVYGGIVPGFVRGKNIVALQTKSSSVGQAVVEAFNLIEQSRSQVLPPSLVEERKRGMAASYVFAHANPSQTLSRVVSLDLLGYPKDYDQTYLKNLAKVTSEELLTLANNRWHTGVMNIVIVGNRQALDSYLSVRNQLPSIYNSVQVEQGIFNEVLQLRQLGFTMLLKPQEIAKSSGAM